MTLIELQNILGNRINVTLSDMDPETRKIENEKTALVIGAAKQMITNANTIMKAAISMSESNDSRTLLATTTILGLKK